MEPAKQRRMLKYSLCQAFPRPAKKDRKPCSLCELFEPMNHRVRIFMIGDNLETGDMTSSGYHFSLAIL